MGAVRLSDVGALHLLPFPSYIVKPIPLRARSQSKLLVRHDCYYRGKVLLRRALRRPQPCRIVSCETKIPHQFGGVRQLGNEFCQSVLVVRVEYEPALTIFDEIQGRARVFGSD
jgi:hypothetical protein